VTVTAAVVVLNEVTVLVPESVMVVEGRVTVVVTKTVAVVVMPSRFTVVDARLVVVVGMMVSVELDCEVISVECTGTYSVNTSVTVVAGNPTFEWAVMYTNPATSTSATMTRPETVTKSKPFLRMLVDQNLVESRFKLC
jgi:hypothetical protein